MASLSTTKQKCTVFHPSNNAAGRWLIVTCMFVAFFQPRELSAQACCSGGIPVTSRAGIQPVEGGSWDLLLLNHLNVLDVTYSGASRLDDQNRKRTNNTLFLQGIYGITPKLSVNTMFMWVANRRTVTRYNGEKENTSISGPGDLLVLFQYQVLDRQWQQFWLGGGSKIPTGRTNLTDLNGILLSRDAQPGSGSWDFIMTASWQAHPAFRPSVFFNLEGILKFNTQVRNSDPPYRFGHEIQVAGSVSDLFVLNLLSISPMLQVKYWQNLPDKTGEAIFPNTGGQWIYFSPSVNLGLHSGISLFTTFEIPVYQNLTGTQLTTSYRFTAGVRISPRKKTVLPSSGSVIMEK